MDSSDTDLTKAVYAYIRNGGHLPEGVSKDQIAEFIKQETKTSKNIDKLLSQEQAQSRMEIVLLLLGTGESGKSTIAKQFRLINNNAYSPKELESFVSIIHSNVLTNIRQLIRFAEDEGIDLSLPDIASEIINLPNSTLTPSICTKIHQLLHEDLSVKKILSEELFSFEDGAAYFINEHLERVSAPDYQPSDQDILHARQKSTGIIETQFINQGALFRIVDVGGQRSERKKWSMLFQDVTGIIFCADVSAYDSTLREDPNVNRMTDSIATFSQICNNRDLQSRDIILFLNKTDLLAPKLRKTPLTKLFPDAPENPGLEDALAFIQQQYYKQNKNPKKFIYVHHTVATDTDNIRGAFTEIVKEIVRKDNVLKSF